MTSCPFSENGMPIKGWPKSLLNGGACSICSAIWMSCTSFVPVKYSTGSWHLSCRCPFFSFHFARRCCLICGREACFFSREESRELIPPDENSEGLSLRLKAPRAIQQAP